jgi:hypothetical protein
LKFGQSLPTKGAGGFDYRGCRTRAAFRESEAKSERIGPRKKRISRIDILFDHSFIDDPRDRWDYYVYVTFANDVPRAIGIKDGKALLDMLRELG